jgi:hypothetical protein
LTFRFSGWIGRPITQVSDACESLILPNAKLVPNS